VLQEVPKKKSEWSAGLAVFLDLKRAFETLNRKLLLEKQVEMGIHGKFIERLKNNLAERSQVVKIGLSKSEQIEIEISLFGI